MKHVSRRIECGLEGILLVVVISLLLSTAGIAQTVSLPGMHLVDPSADRQSNSADSVVNLTNIIAEEAGHLPGYAHNYDDIDDRVLFSVASTVESQPTVNSSVDGQGLGYTHAPISWNNLPNEIKNNIPQDAWSGSAELTVHYLAKYITAIPGLMSDFWSLVGELKSALDITNAESKKKALTLFFEAAGDKVADELIESVNNEWVSTVYTVTNAVDNNIQIMEKLKKTKPNPLDITLSIAVAVGQLAGDYFDSMIEGAWRLHKYPIGPWDDLEIIMLQVDGITLTTITNDGKLIEHEKGTKWYFKDPKTDLYKLYEQIIIKSEIYQHIPEDDLTSISLVSISLSPSIVKPYEQFKVSGYAKYDTGNPVEVGTAIIEIKDKGKFTATVSNGAFSRYIQAPGNSNISNINSNVTVTVSDGLLTACSEPQILTITGIDPEPEDYEFVEAKTCEYVLKDSPYDPYQIKSIFSKDDDHVWVWVHLKNLYKPVQCRWKWYNPDGEVETVHESDYSNHPGEGRYYDCWKWHYGWDLRNPDGGYWKTAGQEGRWRCEVSARTPWTDWEHLATVEFTMRYDLAEHKMCKDVDTQSDPKSPTNIFSPDDTKAVTWAKFINVADPLELKWIYYSPKGFYSENTHTTDDPGENNWHDRTKAWCSINIKGESAEYHCGNWYVDVFVKDAWGNYEKKYTDYFRIEESVSPWISVTATPSSPFEEQSVNLNVSASDNNHLQKIVLHWKDSSEHSKTWDNINACSDSPSHPIGSFSAGQEIEYWAEAWDEAGNHMESVHRIITVRPAKYTLNLSAIGSGTVKSDPTGIDCGLYCSATYDKGTVVTLIPISDDGSDFGGWSGGGCSGTGDCTIKIGSDVTVTATFYAKIQPDLTLSQNDITFSDLNPIEGDIVTITAAIHNIGEKDATSANVSFYEGDPDSGGKQIKTTQFLRDIPASGKKNASVNWDTLGKTGNQIIYVVIADCNPDEASLANNKASRKISVEKKNYGVDLSCIDPEQNILSKGSVTYSIKITNTGNVADTINLTLPEPCYCGWTYSLDRESVKLASGDSTEVKLIVSDVIGYPSGNSWEVKVTGASQYDPLKSGFVVTITTIAIPDVTIDMFVNLEGSSRPDQGYEVPLIVDFFTPGADVLNDTPVYGFGCTTTKDGDNAKAICRAIAPVGIYDITVVSDHTLMNIRRNVEITAPSTSVSMGALQEGDANGDGIINIADFGILATSFMKSKGDGEYDPKADFDCNGIINIADFGLLAGNYMKASPNEIE